MRQRNENARFVFSRPGSDLSNLRAVLLALVLLCIGSNCRVGILPALGDGGESPILPQNIAGDGDAKSGATILQGIIETRPVEVPIDSAENLVGTNSVWRYPVSTVPANHASRAIALLSMGPGAADSTLVERCVISIRKRGRFLDPILILTDSPPSRYEDLTTEDPNIIVLQPLLPDWNWNLRRDMPYKRFKTYILEYLTRDHRLASVELVYYFDIDIVVGQPLKRWFDSVESTYLKNTSSPPSQMVLFNGNISPLQGGQFLVKKNCSEPCLQQWRSHIDSNPKEHKDQPSLTLMWEEQQKSAKAQSPASPSACQLIRMPQKPHLEFIAKKEMNRMKEEGTTDYPMLMHIRNTAIANVISDSLQKEFFRNLLDLPSHLVANVTGKRRIRPNRTWSAIQVNS